MQNLSDYLRKDLNYIWHPYSQAGSQELPIVIKKAKGATLYGEDGKEYLDAISSWWVNLHGHCRPEIQKAVSEQFESLDQVIFAGFSHPAAIDFAQELLEVLPDGYDKVFYSDNGSTAVEVALKMAIQYWHNQGQKREKIVVLKNSYHGDTFGAMSVSERGGFTLPFSDLLFEVVFIESAATDQEGCLSELKNELEKNSKNIAAFIFEPLVQGAGGMLMYGAEALDKMIRLCREYGVVTIADEVMTGFGRTGKNFASQYADVFADILCLSKGITGGVLPLGATVCRSKIFEAFNSADKKKTLFHGHSYTGNALSIAAGRASLRLLKKSGEKLQWISNRQKSFTEELSLSKPSSKASDLRVKNVRHKGTIVAFDVFTGEETSYFHSLRDQLYRQFLEQGVLLRPLGNTIYLMPPYCISPDELEKIHQVIRSVLGV